MRSTSKRPLRLREGNSSRWLSSAPPTSPLGLHLSHRPAPLAVRGLDTLFVVKCCQDLEGYRVYEDGRGYVVAVFSDRTSAERHLEQQVRHVRAQALTQEPDGYSYLDIARRTSLTPGLLHDWVLDIGLEPPPLAPDGSFAGWDAWWDTNRPLMSGWQQERFLDALDLLAPFRVFEVNLLG